MPDTFSEADTRKSIWDNTIRSFAPKKYVLKEVLNIESTDAWNNYFYRKSRTSLTGGTGSDVGGIPRGAPFPFVEKGVTLVNVIPEQYGAEGVIYWQDVMTNNLRIEELTIYDVTDTIVNKIDQVIYNTLSENDTPVNINTVAISAGYEWDSGTLQNRDPVKDILNAIKEITTDGYDILSSGQGYLIVNETDYVNLMSNSKIVNHPTFTRASGIIANGNLGELCGLKIKVTPSVTADKALVVYGQKCGSWKQVAPLKVDVIEDPQSKYTIRASEFGVCTLEAPEAVCLITNTRA